MTNLADNTPDLLARYIITRRDEHGVTTTNRQHFYTLMDFLSHQWQMGHTAYAFDQDKLAQLDIDIANFRANLQAWTTQGLACHAFANKGANEQGVIAYLDSGDTIWCWRYVAYFAERTLLQDLLRISTANVPVLDIPTDGLNTEQAQAVNIASNTALTIITGGPGTGKTYTLAKFVAPLIQQGALMALTAPTGKAAQRVKESLGKILPDIAIEAMTIHRLLGMGRGAPHYHRDNPLVYDIVVVDEASMLGVELAAKLFCAIKTGARVLILGDGDQLAAVEAGSVLKDFLALPFLQNACVRLLQSQRFGSDSQVAHLANGALQGDSTHLACLPVADIGNAIANFSTYFNDLPDVLAPIKRNLKNGLELDVHTLFNSLNKYRILCATHYGNLGDVVLNEACQRAHKRHASVPMRKVWYDGRVVMVQKNRYDVGLYNGDVGVCVLLDMPYLVFEHTCVPAALIAQDVLPAYAMTVHKAQGSEFDHAVLALGAPSTRELVYTAITRAKECASIYANEAVLMESLHTQSIRHTGMLALYNYNANI